MKMSRGLLLMSAAFAVQSVPSNAQALDDLGDSPATTATTTATTTSATPVLTYTRPTQATKLHNYLFDAFGPYPITGAGFAAGLNQAHNTPPEWKQGADGYSRRFGSDFGIAAISTTARYGLAQAFRQDTLYYRCECRGVVPRLRHAMISTLTARQRDDGHRVFSFPALIAPYAGTMTAVYAWYPGRYNAKDALRMGNYTMLGYVGGNIGLEFFYSGPHSLLSRMHLNSTREAPSSGANP